MAALAIAWTVAATPFASATDTSKAAVVALVFDASGNSIIKADGEALYRRNVDRGGWEPLQLPATANNGRVSAVAVSRLAPHLLYIAGPGLGVLRSSDGGRTWSDKRDGLPSENVTALAAHADQARTVYAYLSGKGMFRSEDAGDHWRLMDVGPRGTPRQFIHSNMPGSMQTGWLFAATDKGVARSMDCFCGWRDAGALNRTVTAVVYEPEEPKRVYAATTEGLYVSNDGGEQWTPLSSPGHISALVATPEGGLVAAIDTGILFRSTDRGVTWHAVDG